MPFKPGAGWKGNRAGRPKMGESLTDILRMKLSEVQDIRDEKTGKTRKVQLREIVANKLLRRAVVDGSDDLLKYLFDRIDGKPVQPISGGVPVTEGPDPNISPEERARIQKEMDTFLGRKK